MKGLQLFPTTGTKIQKEEEFFDKNFMMSYSGLNKLLYSPRLFYLHYIMGQRDDSSDKFAIEGKLIHCLFLNPEDFDKEFVLSVNDIPSDNPKEVLQRLYNHYKELNAAGDPRVHLEHFEHSTKRSTGSVTRVNKMSGVSPRYLKKRTSKSKVKKVDFMDY